MKMISLTSSAIDKIKNLMSAKDPKPLGLRVSLITKGCSGLSWKLDFVDEENQFDELIIIEDIRVYIDPKATLFIIGTDIDYITTDLEEGFIFKNPNETGKCGCGESFTV